MGITSEPPCHHCGNSLIKGQSFYANHGVHVCLECFKVSQRCIKCKFPSKKLLEFEGIGNVCEFCQKKMQEENFGGCYLCKQTIYKGASVYEDHGVKVCLKCFKNTSSRCFFCRFPQTIHRVKGLGRFCGFCEPTLIHGKTDLTPLLQPLESFVASFSCSFPENIRLQWVSNNHILKLQNNRNIEEVSTFEELSKQCSPLLFHSGEFFIIERIQMTWLLPLFAGQAVAANLCSRYKLQHLSGNTPFHELARGWSHWISFITAKTLKYEHTFKSLQRNNSIEVSGGFPRFLAMSEYRKTRELILYANETLEEFAQKYL